MKYESTKILVICADEIPSATIGVFEPLKKVQNSRPINVEFIKTIDIRRNHLDSSDVLVFVRSAEKLELRIAEACRKANKFLIYYIDDDLLNIPEAINCAEYFNDSTIKQNILEIMGMCDLLMSVNPLLISKYKKYSRRQVLVKGPSTLLEYSKDGNKIQSEKIKIGFAGSIDHSSTLDSIVGEALIRIGKEYDEKVFFEFVGPKPNIFDMLKNVKHIPYMSNIQEYRKYMSKCSWDIGLAPLPDSDFYKHKYFNKFLEYGAMGICGIYSSTEPFTFIVEDKHNGILVDNSPDDWYHKLKLLIEDAGLRVSISENAFRLLKDSYTLEKVGTEMIEKITELSTYKASGGPIKIFGLTPFQNRILIWRDKIFRIIRKHGIAGIYIIITMILAKLYKVIKSRKGSLNS